MKPGVDTDADHLDDVRSVTDALDTRVGKSS
jgi:hypothetical protein